MIKHTIAVKHFHVPNIIYKMLIIKKLNKRHRKSAVCTALKTILRNRFTVVHNTQ